MCPVHVVIMGCGRVGSSLAHHLERLEQSVAVIDMDPPRFAAWATTSRAGRSPDSVSTATP